MKWLIGLLVWLSGDSGEVVAVQARASASAMVAYSSMARQVAAEEEQPVAEIKPDGGDGVQAQPKQKRMVKRCVNGKCIITYE